MRKKLHLKKKIQNNKKGFTLIELLTIIVIITIIGAIAITTLSNTLNSSKDKSIVLTNENLKEAANTYTKENKEITWNIPNGYATNTAISCVTVNDLINQGYFNEELLENDEIKNITHIIVEKNLENNVIINEYFDEANTCSQNYIYLDTPKCNDNLVYDNTPKTLIKELNNTTGYKKIATEKYEKTDAGTYTVELGLEDGYAWKNGKIDNAKITCTIKKAKTNINLPETTKLDNKYTELDFKAIPLITNTTLNETTTLPGTITASSSNVEYVKIKNITPTPTQTKQITTINLTANSERKQQTEIKVSFTPDNQNYSKSSATFTLISENITNPQTINLVLSEGDLGNHQTSFSVPQGEPYGKLLIYPETEDDYPKRKGYNFSGWYTNITGGTKKQQTDIVTESHTLYGQWKAKKMTVYFDPNGGNVSTSSATVTYDEKYGTLPTPTRTGYTFTGWYTSSTSGTQITKDTQVTITTNQTLYAHWTINKINVQYNMNGGSWAGSTNTTLSYSNNYITLNGSTIVSSYNYGTTNIDLPNYNYSAYINIKKTGYNAVSGKEWKNSSGTTFSHSGGVNSANLCDASNKSCTVTLYVNWTPSTYTVTLNNQGATTVGTTSVTATFNSAMPTITKPSKNYTVTYNYNGNGSANTSATATYTFGGYYTNTGGSGTQYYTAAGASARTWNIANNTTLYANWTSKSVTLPTPTRTGYIFAGWYNASSGGTKIGDAKASYTPTANITLYAHWTPITYQVHYIGNGHTNQTYNDNTQCNDSNKCGLDRYASGSKVSSGTFQHNSNHSYDTSWKLIYNRFKKTGYTFKGWATSSSGTVKYSQQESVKNLSTTNKAIVYLYAKWADETKPSCTITKITTTWDPNGVDLKVSCSDSGSGCTKSSSTYTNVKSDKTYTVKDNSGNEKKCSVSISSRKRWKKRTRSYDSCLSTTRYCDKDMGVQTCLRAENKQYITGKGCCDTKDTCVGGYTSWSSWSSYKYSTCSDSSTVDCAYRTEYK